MGAFCTSEAQREQLAHLQDLKQSGKARLLRLSRLWPAHIALDLAHRTDNRWTEERVRDFLARLEA